MMDCSIIQHREEDESAAQTGSQCTWTGQQSCVRTQMRNHSALQRPDQIHRRLSDKNRGAKLASKLSKYKILLLFLQFSRESASVILTRTAGGQRCLPPDVNLGPGYVCFCLLLTVELQLWNTCSPAKPSLITHYSNSVNWWRRGHSFRLWKGEWQCEEVRDAEQEIEFTDARGGDSLWKYKSGFKK